MYRVSYRIFLLGEGNVFSHASTKHVRGSGGHPPPRKIFYNLASLRLILVQFCYVYMYIQLCITCKVMPLRARVIFASTVYTHTTVVCLYKSNKTSARASNTDKSFPVEEQG